MLSFTALLNDCCICMDQDKRVTRSTVSTRQVVLNCGHIVCFECLQTLVGSKIRNRKCPLCRGRIDPQHVKSLKRMIHTNLFRSLNVMKSGDIVLDHTIFTNSSPGVPINF